MYRGDQLFLRAPQGVRGEGGGGPPVRAGHVRAEQKGGAGRGVGGMVRHWKRNHVALCPYPRLLCAGDEGSDTPYRGHHPELWQTRPEVLRFVSFRGFFYFILHFLFVQV